MIRRPPRSTRPDTSFPTRRSSDLDMRARLGLGNDPHAPRDNILAGTYYLRLMYDCFGYPGLFGAYNAGPARYAAFVRTGRALPAETRAYVRQLAGGPTVMARAAVAQAPRLAKRSVPIARGEAEPLAPGNSADANGRAIFFIRR